MDIIFSNPYRVLGLYGGASEKEIQKNRSKINAYLNTGKNLTFEQDFTFLPQLQRDPELVEAALSMLQLNPSKLKYALLWFARGNSSDDLAFSHLKSGKTPKAINEWMKVTADKENLGLYQTCFNNLGTLILSLLFSNEEIDQEDLVYAVKLKLKLIVSEHFDDFAKLMTDNSFEPNRNQIAQEFLELVLDHLNAKKMSSQTIRALTERMLEFAPDNLRNQFRLKHITQPANDIEALINETRAKRKQDPADGIGNGYNLYNRGSVLAKELEELLGIEDIQYQMLLDKLAAEILQCAIDYFHEVEEQPDFDPASQLLPLMGRARELACGSVTKQRIEQNLEEINEWIAGKPDRIKHAAVIDDVNEITEAIKDFQHSDPDLTTAFNFAQKCRSLLDLIVNAVGQDDELYQKISDTVVNNALSMAIFCVNQVADQIELNDKPNISAADRALWITKNSNAAKVLTYLKDFSMSSEQREHLDHNYSIVCRNALIPQNSGYTPPRSVGGNQDKPTASANKNSANWFWGIVGFLVWIFVLTQCNG